MTNRKGVIRSKAPLRISFAGGGTDVLPYAADHGGAVISATMDKHTYVSLLYRGEARHTTVHSHDYQTQLKVAGAGIQENAALALVTATLETMKISGNMEFQLHSDVPPGSGLGSSSSITVALVALFCRWKSLPWTAYEIAERAYYIEREVLGLEGGRQDQYAATFGGFNFIEFQRNATIVAPLRLGRDMLNELQFRILLCGTGKTRPSAGIVADQIKRYVEHREDTVGALHRTRELAVEMRKALLLGQVDEIGVLLNEAWIEKRKFSSKVTDPQIDDLYEEACKAGAIGGKLLGAGGGGYLLILCESGKRYQVAQRLEALGGHLMHFSFGTDGAQTWEVKDNLH